MTLGKDKENNQQKASGFGNNCEISALKKKNDALFKENERMHDENFHLNKKVDELKKEKDLYTFSLNTLLCKE